MRPQFRTAFVAAFVLVFLSRGAAMAQHFVPVIATDQEQRSFAGVWRGNVESADPRFAGNVEFRFERGGAVILPSHPAPSRILWIRMTRHGIAGALEPYFDAARGEDVYTTFEAELDRGTLKGILRERVRLQWNEAARWSVQRVAK